MYCSNICLHHHSITKLQSLQDRAEKIIFGTNTHNKFNKIGNEFKKRNAIEVYKCINGLNPTIFSNFFTLNNHIHHTRGNRTSLKLPKVKTESGRRSFKFQAALNFNELPLEIRTQTNAFTI